MFYCEVVFGCFGKSESFDIGPGCIAVGIVNRKVGVDLAWGLDIGIEGERAGEGRVFGVEKHLDGSALEGMHVGAGESLQFQGLGSAVFVKSAL